jgi:hypothetical protein
MAPMNQKAPCPNGFEAGKRIGDPVAFLSLPKVAERAVASSEATAISARTAPSSGSHPK